MASVNHVFLMGNLTRDPEVRYTPGGKAVGELRLAVNRRFKTADGKDRDETCFVSIVVWGRQAETCSEYLRKGSQIFVEGRLSYEEWEKDGQKFNRLRVVAANVQFLGSPRGGAGREAAAEPAAPKGDEAAAPDEEPGPDKAAGPDKGLGDSDNLPF